MHAARHRPRDLITRLVIALHSRERDLLAVKLGVGILNTHPTPSDLRLRYAIVEASRGQEQIIGETLIEMLRSRS